MKYSEVLDFILVHSINQNVMTNLCRKLAKNARNWMERSTEFLIHLKLNQKKRKLDEMYTKIDVEVESRIKYMK